MHAVPPSFEIIPLTDVFDRIIATEDSERGNSRGQNCDLGRPEAAVAGEAESAARQD